MDPPLWELYETLCHAGRLRYDAETDRWFLDGEELPEGTDYLRVFREAVKGRITPENL